MWNGYFGPSVPTVSAHCRSLFTSTTGSKMRTKTTAKTREAMPNSHRTKQFCRVGSSRVGSVWSGQHARLLTCWCRSACTGVQSRRTHRTRCASAAPVASPPSPPRYTSPQHLAPRSIWQTISLTTAEMSWFTEMSWFSRFQWNVTYTGRRRLSWQNNL